MCSLHQIATPLAKKGPSTYDDRRTTLRVTDAAFAALNLKPDAAATGADGGQEAGAAGGDAVLADEAPAGPTAPPTKLRAGTKQAQLIEMLRRPEGAIIDEIVAAFGWQPHTARPKQRRCSPTICPSWRSSMRSGRALEHLNDLGEVGERPGQPVDLVDHPRVDEAGGDVGEQAA